MTAKISGALIILSVIFSFFTGKTEALSTAAFSGCAKAVTVSLSLLGMMCLWSGIMKVAKKIGILKGFSKLLSPILALAFPKAYKDGVAKEELSSALAANILGIGNAATPIALNAISKLKSKDGKYDNDIITFTLLGCAPFCILPTTIISLRAASGSISPASVLPHIWVCSLILSVFSIALSRAVSYAVSKK